MKMKVDRYNIYIYPETEIDHAYIADTLCLVNELDWTCIIRENAMQSNECAFLRIKKKDRPHIVCLCGSTRFYEAFQKANYDLTMQGHIVLSVGFYPHAQEKAHGQNIGCTEDEKRNLDALHFQKIKLADEVFILNVDGYVGESTDREIEYAKRNKKQISWLEPDKIPEKFRARM